MNWVADLKRALRISDIIRRYFNLGNKHGTKYVIQCPFHSEKTPSFSIDDERNMFYCFGCKVGGDAIRFIELIEKLSFTEACKHIAPMYGIIPPALGGNEQNELSCLKIISKWCSEELKKNQNAMNYLKMRGLTQQTISDFRIGWLGNSLPEFCKENGIKEQALNKVGLPKSVQFLFTNRIIFPIYSKGQVIALGGRCIENPSKRAKYVNTAENEYFKKKETMYSVSHIQNTKTTLLVEGYLDVCMCVQSGIVAASSMGTSVSRIHVAKLWETSDEVVMCLDGDNAGKQATIKLTTEMLKYVTPGKVLSFIDMPPKSDPASFLAEGGSLHDLPRISFVDKLWEIFNPRRHRAAELSVATYQDLLAKLQDVQDNQLRRVYVNEVKSKWFGRKEIASTYYKPANNKQTYELILLITLVQFPQIFDETCEYILSLDLTGQLHELRELLLENARRPLLDFYNTNLVQYAVSLCPPNKLAMVAPFTKYGDTKMLLSGWFEVFCFYTMSYGGGSTDSGAK